MKAPVILLMALFSCSIAWARNQKMTVVSDAAPVTNTTMVRAPQDQEVCFSPDEPCNFKLEKFIESAERSVDIAIYDINLTELVHVLLVQARKISVKIIVDRRQAKGPHSMVPLLVRAGAKIKYGHQRGIMHNKFTIIDGIKLETGSFNYTRHAAEANSENQIYLTNPKIVNRYNRRFELLWKNGTPIEGN